MPDKLEPSGAAVIEAIAIMPCAIIEHIDGRKAHLCGASHLVAGWGEGGSIAGERVDNPVIVQLITFDKAQGFLMAVTAEQARTFATSLLMLADKVGGPLS